MRVLRELEFPEPPLENEVSRKALLAMSHEGSSLQGPLSLRSAVGKVHFVFSQAKVKATAQVLLHVCTVQSGVRPGQPVLPAACPIACGLRLAQLGVGQGGGSREQSKKNKRENSSFCGF